MIVSPNITHHLLTTSAAILCALVLPARLHASPPQYVVTVLGDLGGGSSEASSVNASEQVAGTSDTPSGDGHHAVIWKGTKPTDLGTLGGNRSVGIGINASGQVVGLSETPEGGTHAVLWTGGKPVDLGGYTSTANGINAAGQATGMSDPVERGTTIGHAVRWTGTVPTDLGTLV